MIIEFTDEFVENLCRVFEENDWLQEGWDAPPLKNDKCPECGSKSEPRNPYGPNDNGEDTKQHVRQMLERAASK